MAFLTILPAPGLSPARRRRANRLGPVAVALPTSYPSLLRSAGFVDVDEVDLTHEYEATQRRWIEAGERHEAGMRESMGDDLYDDRAETRHRTAAAIDAGLLRRRLYSAVR